MKKSFLIIAIIVFGFINLNAQTEKGKWMFGSDASVAFSSTTVKAEFNGDEIDGKETLSTFTFSPSANYFVMDNLALGLDLSFSSTKDKYEEPGFDEDFTTSGFGIIPNATYFFKSDKIAPYIGAGAGLLSTSYGDEDQDKFSGLAIKAQGGVAIFLSDSVALNVGVDFLTSKLANKEDSDYKAKTNTLGVGVGFAIFL